MEMGLYETVREVSVLLEFAVVDALRALRIGTGQFNVLGILSGEPDLRMNEIASRVLLDDSTTTRIVDGLEARTLVVRRADPVDRRARRVSITHDGRRVLFEAQQRCERAVAERIAPLGAREAATLERVIGELRSVLLSEEQRV
ncbi:MAG TPA: MarR family transcriptional regulator [Spirochaetia bacterium]|nr:MarR family transcriptional regulator [Spirochaetia bacterium]